MRPLAKDRALRGSVGPRSPTPLPLYAVWGHCSSMRGPPRYANTTVCGFRKLRMILTPPAFL